MLSCFSFLLVRLWTFLFKSNSDLVPSLFGARDAKVAEGQEQVRRTAAVLTMLITRTKSGSLLSALKLSVAGYCYFRSCGTAGSTALGKFLY